MDFKHLEKKNYFSEALRENSHNPKQLWKKIEKISALKEN